MRHREEFSVINHLHIVFKTFDAEGPFLGFNPVLKYRYPHTLCALKGN